MKNKLGIGTYVFFYIIFASILWIQGVNPLESLFFFVGALVLNSWLNEKGRKKREFEETHIKLKEKYDHMSENFVRLIKKYNISYEDARDLFGNKFIVESDLWPIKSSSKQE